MNFANLIGQVIDGKYRIERQLGKGGMGTVYLATHLGTERPVALKVIVQQFMARAEFVERFRREARAAGRLRHPNVVDVTDFGVAEMATGKVAYLVMEYLDGCTLGEILEEEKQLPLLWSLDILEQVCSAVHAAHEQGIIHRDLKPDNIWLEPNQRGGYTVKVLDFGIAKLEEPGAAEQADEALHISALPTQAFHLAETVPDNPHAGTLAGGNGSTLVSEAGTAVMMVEGETLIQPVSDPEPSEKGTAILETGDVDLEGGTAILPSKQTGIIEKEDGTRMLSAAVETDKPARVVSSTSELTRVGAVLGTPLYMSPEQCRGEKLSPRSDIYSLGVIAYQMLGGKTPFEGDFTSVMQAHKEIPPPPLVAKKVPRKIKKVIGAALAKNPDERPPSAEAFATQLRAQSEGIATLLRRSLVIYSEHLPKFLGVTTIFTLPVFVLTVTMIVMNFLRLSDVINKNLAESLYGLASFAMWMTAAFCTNLTVGATTWIVAQYLAVPLRPVRVRPALRAVGRRWKQLAWTGILKTLIGIGTCGLGFLIGEFIWSLFPSVVMMEKLSGWKSLKRTTALFRRSALTTIASILILLSVPMFISGSISYVVFVSARAFAPDSIKERKVDAAESSETESAAAAEQGANTKKEKKGGITINLGTDQQIQINDEGKDMRKRVIETFLGSLIQILWLPMHLFVASFTSIVLALLYLKTRQVGGETIQDLLDQFEESEGPKSKWQLRVQERLIQSGRITTGKT
ncbi:MAG: protein kinase [Acidobacteria bacterium]|nr:protein kinase [Acidobacteriota bacterium]